MSRNSNPFAQFLEVLGNDFSEYHLVMSTHPELMKEAEKLQQDMASTLMTSISQPDQISDGFAALVAEQQAIQGKVAQKLTFYRKLGEWFKSWFEHNDNVPEDEEIKKIFFGEMELPLLPFELPQAKTEDVNTWLQWLNTIINAAVKAENPNISPAIKSGFFAFAYLSARFFMIKLQELDHGDAPRHYRVSYRCGVFLEKFSVCSTFTNSDEIPTTDLNLRFKIFKQAESHYSKVAKNSGAITASEKNQELLSEVAKKSLQHLTVKIKRTEQQRKEKSEEKTDLSQYQEEDTGDVINDDFFGELDNLLDEACNNAPTTKKSHHSIFKKIQKIKGGNTSGDEDDASEESSDEERKTKPLANC